MNNDADNIELQEAGEKNPMHSESGKDAGPSSAYLESVRRMRESKEWKAAQIEASGGYNRSRITAGWKTKASILGLLVTGVVLFLTGTSFYFDTSSDKDERKIIEAGWGCRCKQSSRSAEHPPPEQKQNPCALASHCCRDNEY